MKYIFSILTVATLLVSCQKENNLKNDPFLIAQHKIGKLTNTVQLYQLDSIYKQDSIVKRIAGDEFLNTSNQIDIYDKAGNKLLVLEAEHEFDSTSTIKNIEVIDTRFHTEGDLKPKGYFIDIKKNYPISKINNTLSSAVVFVDSIGAYFTIDKKELSSEYKFDTDIKIEADKIPDSARIKNFWITWDKNH
ncbi:hypothetical protein [Aquimarina rhabdastrellae]